MSLLAEVGRCATLCKVGEKQKANLVSGECKNSRIIINM